MRPSVGVVDKSCFGSFDFSCRCNVSPQVLLVGATSEIGIWGFDSGIAQARQGNEVSGLAFRLLRLHGLVQTSGHSMV